MTDDFCVFVILASLIGLALPSAAVMIYLGFASVFGVPGGDVGRDRAR